MRTRPPLAVVVALSAVLMAGCSGDDDARATDTEPTGDPSSTSGSPGATEPGAGPGTDDAPAWPSFEPADYVYRLEVLCFCPLVGPLRVTVEDDEVVSATSISGETRGQEAPEYARLTINQIIDRANDPRVARADVTWPDGQDHPSTVAIDQIEKATDDEVTYTIRNVRISGG